LQKELVGRVRSLRFFQSVRDLQQAKLSDSVTCQVCAQTKKGTKSVCAKSLSGVLSTCGHVGCLECLKTNAENQECGVEGCDCATRDSSVVTADSLGTEGASKGKNNGKTDGGVGVHGSKIIDLVAHIKSIPEDERVLVFVQFTDLMQQVSSALNEAGIKTLKLKGSVHQQTAALDEFQKEDLKKHDARVLLLLSRDESASGANLTTANHAIFVHPLLTNTAQEYIASETQAIGRIRRYGQQREVRIWRFIVRDSIDSEILSQRSANASQQK
jgi:SNF2 family DNA or RNA helicase